MYLWYTSVVHVQIGLKITKLSLFGLKKVTKHFNFELICAQLYPNLPENEKKCFQTEVV